MEILNELMSKAIELEVSDLHVTIGQKAFFRKDGELNIASETLITAEVIEEFLKKILSEEQYRRLVQQRELDFSFKYESR